MSAGSNKQARGENDDRLPSPEWPHDVTGSSAGQRALHTYTEERAAGLALVAAAGLLLRLEKRRKGRGFRAAQSKKKQRRRCSLQHILANLSPMAATVSSSQPAPPPPRVCTAAVGASLGRRLRSEVPHFIIDLSLPPAQRWTEVVRVYSPYWADMVTHMWAEYEQAADEEEEEEEEEDAADEQAAKAKRQKKKKSPPLSAAARAAAAATAAAAAAARRAARVAEHVAFATALATNLLANFRREGLGEYADELESVSFASGISVADLVLLNLSYEAHGGCTSIVAQLPGGHLMLGRTLDWQHEHMLSQLTIELSFVREGKLLYRAASFAGFLAIFTGHVPSQKPNE